MKHFVNLLPFEHRRRSLLRSRLLRWSLVWMACVTLAVAVSWLKRNSYRSSILALQAAQRRYAPLEKLIRERDDAKSELSRLHAKGTVLGQLCEQRPTLTLMGVVSESARQCGGRLVVRNLLFQRRERRTEDDGRQSKNSQRQSEDSKNGKKSGTETSRPWATVTFEGDALDNLAIARFAAGLRDTGLFRRVGLKSSLGQKSPRADFHSFIVECEI